MKTSAAGVSLHLDLQSLHFSVTARGETWSWARDYVPRLVSAEGEEIPFTQADNITHSLWDTGVGRGIRSQYEDFTVNGRPVDLSFETIVWIQEATGEVYFEFIPISEEGISLKAVYWPGPMAFDTPRADWYSALNVLQGLIVPNTWENQVGPLHFEGQMCSCSAYMPWFGQVKPGAGYIAICQQPWDAASCSSSSAGHSAVWPSL